jgi:hypothetical protein
LSNGKEEQIRIKIRFRCWLAFLLERGDEMNKSFQT